MTPKLLNTLLLLLSVVLYFMFIKPIYLGTDSGVWTPGDTAITKLRKLSMDYDVTLKEADRLIIKANKLQAQYKEYDTDLKSKLELMVPNTINELVFYNELAKMFTESGQPDSFGIKDKGTGEYSVSFSVMKTYTQFKEYITFWENNMRLFSLQNVTITPGKTELDPMKFSLEFSTYYLDKKIKK